MTQVDYLYRQLRIYTNLLDEIYDSVRLLNNSIDSASGIEMVSSFCAIDNLSPGSKNLKKGVDALVNYRDREIEKAELEANDNNF